MNGRLLLRLVALSIAVLALIDPSCTRERRDRPIVAVVGDNASRSTIVAQRAGIHASLASRYVVVDGAMPAADAVVLLGEALPLSWRVAPPTQPVVVVTPDTSQPHVGWRALRAPTRARVGEAVTIEGELALGALGDSVITEVRQDEVVLAREIIVRSNAAAARVSLPVVPVDTGAITWEVRAELRSARGVVSATQRLRLDVHDRPVRVSGIDVRPSWAATFARRALSADERFELTARVAVSRSEAASLDRTSGSPPVLNRLPAPPALDVLVLGAAHALSPAAVSSLDRWVRDAGGSAVLVLDETPAPAVSQWLGVAAWRRVERAEPVVAVQASNAPRAPADGGSDVGARDSVAAPLRGREWLVPTTLPSEAEAWLTLASTGGERTESSSAVVWSRALGRGTVVVVGAVDAWTFREATRSDFTRTWRALVADAAARRAPDAELIVRPSAHADGWMTAELAGDAEALARWSLAEPVFTLMDARGETLRPSGVGPLRAPIGTAWRASRSSAAPVISLSAAAERTDAASSDGAAMTPLRALIPVARGDVVAAPAELIALAAASGGAVVPAASLATLDTRLDAILAPAVRRGPWHPWRSPWWLLPFTAALLGEWWWRRRLGQP